MIRILTYSEDPKLQLLSSALGQEFDFILESDKDKVKKLVAEDAGDVLLLDLDSDKWTPKQQLAAYEEVAESALIPVVVMTNDMSRVRAMEFLQNGAYDCIRKPPSIIELKVVIRRAHEHANLKKELDRVRVGMYSGPACDQLVGSSGRAQLVYDLIRRVADLKAFVLISGESGTGKELVARAIHNLGTRAKEPFIAVSCGAIPETLIESELFGHEKGAFTGSTGARPGYFEQAGNGTLFLDEIGELSLSTQVKLLRVLQEREFSRLGSNKVLPLNARVVFATHRNLQKMTEEGTFRRDLFFRVNVMSIHVPPLRDRTEDIPGLARHFLERYAEEYGKAVGDIRPNAMELLVEYHWPGNIRELENVIQGAVIRADGNSITRTELPEHIQELAGEMCAPSSEADSFDELVRQYKVELVHKALAECGGNKSLAAKKLKVSRPYLHRLIRGGPDHEDIAGPISTVTPFKRRAQLSAS